MTPTVEYLEERFDSFNASCFEGALPRIPIKLSRARSFVGRLQYKPIRNWRGKVVGGEGFVIRISTKFDLPEVETEDTLIHEMIHYWIVLNGLQDSSTHGRIFRAKMKEINEAYMKNILVPAVAHVVVKVLPGGNAYRIYLLEAHDESMNVLSVVEKTV